MPKTKKSITSRDIEIGKRIRLRRAAIRMSQGTLGGHLGITFQQVQKYEKGSNRIAAGRLEQIAQLLGAPITYFYDDVKNIDSVENPLQFFNALGVVPLAQAYAQIHDVAARAELVKLAQTMARLSRSKK